ncbi:MAG: serine hydrolase [Paracoccus sp. (in: a-proteobacteria)]|uniref:D-alanyl-D-alanine carboxypeptidase family protein n=1 Tax=Paracoccus sp. TaxID=267 RepID=UPI0026DFECCA|nr:serine hydrolase [Paracoccus sp. (in: a-proteobacteria)]MDO5630976.1 serine hydrolase [Paracoccus sp. (in: a-proteobacteria)]
MKRFTLAARLWAFVLIALALPATVNAAPFAAHVMDARTGKPIYAQNASTRLHPASLTKMMTLYMAFAAVEQGRVRLDSRFTISSNAAAEPPSKLGLRAGQQIELRYLIRAAAIKSANDAATAIGEGLAGSEAAFAQQMNATARALGMRNTNFRNANGLTQEGHYSTAEDMSILGRRLFYDFPQYYSLFSRRSADAGVAQVSSTNKRFLDDYPGADGIKTGYTRAAGFNLTASAQRGNKRIIATVFGGTSTAQRNQVMAQLLDTGFGRAPDRVREIRPEPLNIPSQRVVRRAQVQPEPTAVAAQPQRLVLSRSAPPRQVQRATDRASLVAAATPAPAAAPEAAPAARLVLAASQRPAPRPSGSVPEVVTAAETAPEVPAQAPQSASIAGAIVASARPTPAPRNRAAVAEAAPEPQQIAESAPAPAVEAPTGSLSLLASPPPQRRSETVILAAMGEGDISSPEAVQIVRRPAATGRNYGLILGTYTSRSEAEQRLLQSALQDGGSLSGARRNVADTRRGFEAHFSGLTRSDAQLACERLTARGEGCKVTGP